MAHDSAVRANKRREPHQTEEERVAAVQALPDVDEVILGRKTANRYHVLSELEFDILVLGYNQKPSEEEVRTELDQRGK